MGSYGIGPSRLVAAIIEASHDDNGIIWPEAITPFDIGIINMKPNGEACTAESERLYEALTNSGLDVLYDDTDKQAGAKFASMDLIGVPWQIVIGPRGLANNQVEVKCRADGSKEMLSPQEALNRFAAI